MPFYATPVLLATRSNAAVVLAVVDSTGSHTCAFYCQLLEVAWGEALTLETPPSPRASKNRMCLYEAFLVRDNLLDRGGGYFRYRCAQS